MESFPKMGVTQGGAGWRYKIKSYVLGRVNFEMPVKDPRRDRERSLDSG